MITPQELSERLEALREAETITHEAALALGQELFNAQLATEQAKNDLASARAAAVVAEEIQQKDHGRNQALRDAHERDWLKVNYQNVTIAEMNEREARYKVSEVEKSQSHVRHRLRLAEMQTRLVTLVYGIENAEQMAGLVAAANELRSVDETDDPIAAEADAAYNRLTHGEEG